MAGLKPMALLLGSARTAARAVTVEKSELLLQMPSGPGWLDLYRQLATSGLLRPTLLDIGYLAWAAGRERDGGQVLLANLAFLHTLLGSWAAAGNVVVAPDNLTYWLGPLPLAWKQGCLQAAAAGTPVELLEAMAKRGPPPPAAG